MDRIKLPQLETSLPRLGLGCMGMSEFYGPKMNEQSALSVLRQAYEGGIRHFDSADFYGDGDNERLLAKFIKQVDADVSIASKCGIVRGAALADGNFKREFNNQPSYIKAACEASLQRLGVECLDLYYLHRIDPDVAIEDSVQALADLVKEGKIKAIGLCEAQPDLIHRAQRIHPLSAVQSEYSIWSRGVEEDILPTCRALNIPFVAYSPLGRGMLPRSTNVTQFDFSEGDFRLTLERATAANMTKNQPLYELLYQVADNLGISPFQLMLAWLMAQGDDIIAIPGSTKADNIAQNIRAAELRLDKDISRLLSNAFNPATVAGGRYTVNKEVAANASAMS